MKTKMKFAICALVCMTMACAAASAEGSQPDGNTEKPELPEIGGGLDEVQLKSLLDAGVITQEQYDALLELLTDSGDAA